MVPSRKSTDRTHQRILYKYSNILLYATYYAKPALHGLNAGCLSVFYINMLFLTGYVYFHFHYGIMGAYFYILRIKT